jgi:hypothetical protein
MAANNDPIGRGLLLVTGLAALGCVAELLWLRSVQGIEVSRLDAGLLFIPWLFAAASNLALWYWTLKQRRPTPLNRLGLKCVYLVSAGFAAGFTWVYGTFVFSWF